MMKKKREVAVLLPYRQSATEFEFFLQKRGVHEKTNPNLLDLFGGGLEEGETIEQALLREIKEELNYVPRELMYFSRYENATHVGNVFLEEVDTDFESLIHVSEGEYGIFLTLEKLKLEEVFAQTLLILQQVSRMLHSK